MVEVFPDGVTMDNVERFVRDADVIVDGIDISVMQERKAMFDIVREENIPVFSSPVIGFGAGLAVFDPMKSPSFTEFFGEIAERDTPEWHNFILKFGMMFMGFKPEGIDIQLAQQKKRKGKAPAIAPSCRVNCALVTTGINWSLFKQRRDTYRTNHITC